VASHDRVREEAEPDRRRLDELLTALIEDAARAEGLSWPVDK